MLGTMPDAALAKLLGRGQTTVFKRRRRLGIEAHRGHGNDRKRIRSRSRNGYALVRLPHGDPFIEMVDCNGYVREHRLVMAEHLGRPLTIDEVVHHKNGEKKDNRLENLELWTRAHPDGQRVDDVLEWCVEFIERYAQEVDDGRES